MSTMTLYTGGLNINNMENYLWEPVKCGLYKQVVFIYIGL